MKEIRLGVNTPSLPEGSKYTHTGTTWLVAKTPIFDPEDILYESIDSPDLLSKTIAIDIFDDDVFYVKTKYHYTDTKGDKTSTHYSLITSSKGTQKGIKLSSNIVATPNLTIEFTTANNSKGEYYCRTSGYKMFIGSGEHHSTSWYFKDTDGKLLYKREYDKENLYSIRIDEEYYIDRMLMVECIMHSDTNAVSNKGKTLINQRVNSKNDYEVKLVGDLVKDRKLYFDIDINTNMFSSLNIKVVDAEDKYDLLNVENLSLISPFIYTDNFTIGKSYIFYSQIKLVDGRTLEYRTIGTYTTKDKNYLFNSLKTYLHKFDYRQKMNMLGIGEQSSCELYNGGILLHKYNSNIIELHKLIDGYLVKLNDAISLPLSNSTYKRTKILQLMSGDIAVIYTSDEDELEETYIAVYVYNPVDQRFYYKYNHQLPNIYSGLVTSSVIGYDGLLYFVPTYDKDIHGDYQYLDMYTFNFDTKEIELVNDLPFNVRRNVSLTLDYRGYIIIGGGTSLGDTYGNSIESVRTNDKIYSYDTTQNTFKEIGNNLLSDIPTNLYAFEFVTLNNNQILLMNRTPLGEGKGNKFTHIINLNTETIETKYAEFDNMPYFTIVKLLNGDIITISTTGSDPELVYFYISNTLEEANLDYDQTKVYDGKVLKVEQDLVVDDLYQYTDVIISEGTTLEWYDGDEVRVFTHKHLIITRSQIMSREEYEAGKWEYVFVLDNVNFIIED